MLHQGYHWFVALSSAACLAAAFAVGTTSSSAAVPGRPSFQQVVIDEKPPLNPWVKLAGDFNGDGKLDIAIGGQKGPLVWYVNPGWRKWQIAESGWQTVAGAVGDVDGDGDADIVPGAQVWFENPRPQGDPAEGTWTSHKISDVVTHDVVLADLDRDGKPDLVGRDQSSFGHNAGNRIHFWRQEGPERWNHHWIDCPHGEGLAVADLDRDGDPDVLIGGRWFENDGRVNGAWRSHSFTTNWTWADTKVALGDINGDGRLDIVLAPAELQGQQYRLAWYEAPARPTLPDWREHIVAAPVEAVMHGLAVADINGDGRADIVAARMHQGAPPQEVSIYLNPGQRGDWRKVVVSDRGSHDILVADFNGDGRPDILGANHGGTRQPVELWLSTASADDRTRATSNEADEAGFDPSQLQPFTSGVPYLGKHETGLYPGGSNQMPSAHRRAGERLAATIRPLNGDGQPDDQSGRILALAMGHSNCRMYFGALQKHLAGRAAELHPRFELLNAAVGGQQLPQIVRLQGPVWDSAWKLTSRPGYSAQQVQVLLLHTTWHGWKNERREPPGPFPQTMQQMQRDLATVLEHCLKLYPNLKIAYLTCDGFRHFTGYEPHVWQEAFAMKWLIGSQIAGEPGTGFEGAERRLPWLAWGPYFWDNSWDRTYFTDGVHPAPRALEIFVEKYWQHLRQDSVARPWLFSSGQDTGPSGRMGPLKVCAANPRYFADPSGKPVYLTGSHTWQSLQDGILADYTVVAQPFDYTGYLNLLQTNHHNFIRLWRWELTTHEPQPWGRTGPGDALDGKPKFDLRQFSQPYFDRLRARIMDARARGIYVSIMLFEDWIFMNKRKEHPLEQHPFHKDNNVSGINGDPNGDGWGLEIHTLQVPGVVEIQKAYVRKVIETVNDLDNVLYEICNEGLRHTREWQYEMVRFIKGVEATLPKQHPVGMTSVGDMNEDCLKSPADWTSLATTGWDQAKDPWTSAPPGADGKMVCLLDTDHLGWKVYIDDAAFARAWVWKSFTRGHNPLLMENLATSAGWIAGRAAMGYTRRFADRMNLAAARPADSLASTGYCLANAAAKAPEYLIYLPAGGEVKVDLSASPGKLAVEWFNPVRGTGTADELADGGALRTFKAPFTGDAVLYLTGRAATSE